MRIALSGKAGCGKSTLADYLVIDHGFLKFSFADELKDLCWFYFPKIMAGTKEEYRPLLQRIGEAFRHEDSDIWLTIVINKIESQYPFHPIVIDDVRYRNEFLGLKKLGFKLIRIERGPKLRMEWGYDVNDSHSSETDLDNIHDWDLVIQNDGPYPFLEATDELLKFLGLKKLG